MGQPLGNKENYYHMKTNTVVTVSLLCIKIACATQMLGACDPPKNLQEEISKSFLGARVVTWSDLNINQEKFFRRQHKDGCPGMVKIDFYGDHSPTIALVLITAGGTPKKVSLAIARQIQEQWRISLLDSTDTRTTPAVWSEPPGKYRDVYGEEEVRATTPVIVFSSYESWSILYSWDGREINKIWLQD